MLVYNVYITCTCKFSYKPWLMKNSNLYKAKSWFSTFLTTVHTIRQKLPVFYSNNQMFLYRFFCPRKQAITFLNNQNMLLKHFTINICLYLYYNQSDISLKVVAICLNHFCKYTTLIKARLNIVLLIYNSLYSS